MCSQKNKYLSGSFKAQAALCAREMCIEEVCDARIGMCVHVPLMHSHSRCRVSCVGPAVDILAVVKSDVATVGASGRSHRLSCHRSACDKRALKGTQKPLQLFTERHHNPSQAVVFIYVGHSAAFLPLSLSLAPGGMCGRREGWMDRWREGVPC